MNPALLPDRHCLLIDGRRVGSIAAPLIDSLIGAGFLLDAPGRSVELVGEPDPALARIADWLRQHGHAGRWRDEKLAVADTQGRVLASVERGVVRVLGIATTSVQLHARAGDGNVWWLQQRALDKATDPGLWDTLMGGMVAAGETVEQALFRETLEEAGIDLKGIAVRPAGSVTVRRPVTDSGSHGLLVETMHACECTLTAGVVPANRDGEVLQFRRYTNAGIDRLAAAGQLTQEAATAVALCRAPGSR